MILPITSKLMPYETPAVFTARLSLLNGVERPWTFCQDLGLEWKDVQSGEVNALKILSEISGAEFKMLIYNCLSPTKTPGHLGAKTYICLHSNQFFPRSFFPSKVFAICPKCLEEGVGYNVRWKFKGLTSCPLHGIVLHCVDNSIKPADCEVYIAKLTMGKAHISANELRETDHLSFDRYIEKRLSGEKQNGWLEEIPIHAVAYISEILGGMLKYGVQEGISPRPYCERNELIHKGYEQIKNGSENYCNLIAKLQSTHSSARAYGLGALYRLLYNRRHDAHYNVFLELTNKHIQSTSWTTEFGYVFGEPIEVPNAISLHKLSIQCGMNKYKLIDFINSHPELKCEVYAGRVSIEDGKKILGKLPKAISNTHAASIMGISLDLFSELIRRKLIVVPDQNDTEKLIFSQVYINDFMSSIYEKARKSKQPKSAKTIYEISTKLRIKICDIIQEIVNSGYSLFWFDHSQRSLLKKIILIEDEVRYHFLGPEPDGLSAENAANFLSIHITSIHELVRKKILTSTYLHSNLRRRMQNYINQNRLNEFSRTYVSVAEAAEILGTSRQRLICDFDNLGLEPALIGSNYKFFIRDEVERRARNCSR